MTVPDRKQDIDVDIEAEEKRRLAAIALIQSWRDADDMETQEQRETWAFLQQALNTDRLSERKRLRA